MNRLTASLAEICNRHMLAEKWLVAPSRRVGQQWLEAVTRSGQSVVNVRIKTLTSLAIDLVAEQMVARGVTLLSSHGGEILIKNIIRRLQADELGYLKHLEPSAGLAEAVYASVFAIRQAGLDIESLDTQCFEVASKGRDLRVILNAYLAELEALQIIDDAELLRMAIARISRDANCLPNELLLLVPTDIECSPLERELLESFPQTQRHILPIDEPAAQGDAAQTDLELLRWLQNPTEAPSPAADGTVRIRRAVGEVNEVRDVLRCCVSGQVRFDDVELLHTDSESYVPLVYETFCTLAREGETLGDDLPVTFAEGVPCRYSRPGRALALWLTWIADDYPQRTLVQMLREGLLEASGSGEEFSSHSRLSGLLRVLGIGFGRERYRAQLQERINGLRQQLDEPAKTRDDDEEPPLDRLARLRRQLESYQLLDALCEKVLDCSPIDSSNPLEVLAGATKFLGTLARTVNQMDRFAVLKLVAEVSEMQRWLALGGGDVGFDALEWLARLPSETRVLGSGPRPGCLHLAHVLSGGHSGRPHTLIIGLDDSRFPGAGMQDPLLLDNERRKLSPELTTAADRLEHKRRDITRLLARLRGKVTLSYCMRSVDDDREMFPSSVVLAAYRLISGKRDGDQSDLAAWLAQESPPASFAPHLQDECLSAGEWWLWRLCGATPVRDSEALVLQQFPHLGRGRHAAAERQRTEFTEYDGRVTQAGPDLDPTRSDHQVLSANRLQKIGKCPLMYFFEYGLDIKAPSDLGVDPTVWLDALTEGSLLHEVFEQFIRELLAIQRIPLFQRDETRLRELLAVQIVRYRELYPPPSESVFQRQRVRLEQAVVTFLREEERHCNLEKSRPVYLEASLGMPADGHGTPLDTPNPIPVQLGGRRQVRLRGRIDRIDLIGDGVVKTFAIWDYKTGGTWGYDKTNPFRQGRILQPYLYVTMVTHQLRAAVAPDASVSHFGFFFPGAKGLGERIPWPANELAPGREVLERLVQIVRSGAFLATNNVEDCNFCNYRKICGVVEPVVAASKAKLAFLENELLTPMRELRR